MADWIETGEQPPAKEESPSDLFSLLSTFSSRMAILSSIAEPERFWEDPTALKVALAAFSNARYLRDGLERQMAMAESAHAELAGQIITVGR